MIFKIINTTPPEGDAEDARVHCVVLKVRAVPPPIHNREPERGPESQSQPRKASSGPSGPNSVHAPGSRSLHVPTASKDDVLAETSCAGALSNVPPMSSGRERVSRIRLCRFRRTAVLLRKEVIQPHLPVRLPCYDLVLITDPTFDSSLPQGVRPPASGVTDFHDLTGGVYKTRERIHRSVADLRLLATPTS